MFEYLNEYLESKELSLKDGGMGNWHSDFTFKRRSSILKSRFDYPNLDSTGRIEFKN
jgi:hypothetical protein